MRTLLTTMLALLLTAGVANAGSEMAGTRLNIYVGGGSITPSDGEASSGFSLGFRLEQFRPGYKIGGGIDAKGIFTGKGEGHSGGYGLFGLYRRVAGSYENGVYFGFDFGYLGYEWKNRSLVYNGEKRVAEWGGVDGIFAAPTVRVNLFGNTVSFKASYFAWGSGEQKVNYKFLFFEDTYITPDANFNGFSFDLAISKEWKPGYFFGVNANYTSVKFDSVDTTDPVNNNPIHLDSVRVNSWTVGVVAGLRW
jgi:hypothetical protein